MRGKGYLLVIAVLIGFYMMSRFTVWLFVFLIWLFLLLIWYWLKRLTLLELAVIVFMTLFFSHHFIQDEPSQFIELDSQVVIRGKVTDITSQTVDYTIFTIDQELSNESIQVNDFSGQNSMIKIGANCTVTGKVQQPNHATNPGQFNYQRYLAGQGLHYQLIINDNDSLYCEGSNLVGKLHLLRQSQLTYLDEHLDEFTSAWVKSLVLGDRSAIDEDVLTLFQRWHLTHLLSISGLHISIIVVILHFVFLHIFRLTKETTYQILIMFLLFYPFLAGGAPSIWRASIVSSLNYVAWYYRHRVATIDFLSLSFVVLLFLKPEWIYHLGFQFSYLITFAIIFSQKILQQLPHYLLKSAYITGLSIFMTIPIQVSHFYIFNPYSFLLNILTTLYFSLFLIPTVFLTYVASIVFQPLTQLLDLLIVSIHSVYLEILTFIDHYFYQPIVTGELSPLFIFLFYLALFYLLAQIEKRCWRKIINAFLSLLLILTIHQIKPYLNPYGKVTTLDVGQADTLIIELPHRSSIILYDVGASLATDFRTPTNKAYQDIIKPYLYKAGISKIDAVILSHEDSDHIGSLPYLLTDFSVGKIITSSYFEWPEQFLPLLSQFGVEHQTVSFGQSFAIADQIFYVVSPKRDWQNINDNSLVLYTHFSDNAWLLTGDISEQVELEILKNIPNLNVNTLSIPHHGSASSSSETFIKAIYPEDALISVGRNNLYTHPNQEVIERLIKHGVRIFRTDQNGAIEFIFHKNRIGGTFLPYLP